MDNSFDTYINFDEKGVCNYCKEFLEREKFELHKSENGLRKLDKLISQIIRHGRGKEYDVVIGLSGGVDSSYVALKCKEYGLKALAVHLDNGWNNELAVHNIEKLLKYTNYDLFTEVLDWETFRNLQLAFLRSSVINIEIPTDHAINSVLFNEANKRGIRYIISGSNLISEGIMPSSYTGYDSFDWKHIKAINNSFSNTKLINYPHMALFHWGYYSIIKGIKYIPILNYIDYHKENAKAELTKIVGWQDYKGKHYESFFTRFYQSYILYQKFGIDKRRPHFSTLINSGQMTREAAIEELKQLPFDLNTLEIDIEYFIKKLKISREDYDVIISSSPRSHFDYPNYNQLFLRFQSLIRKIKNKTTGRD